MNFATVKGLTIPEGVVTRITDESGGVLWAVQNNKPVILQVAKVTSDTYAGETTYTGEQFILLDIYPKTNGTVKVTYGGLTKTITDTSGAEEPNAQQVFFGTFNGVSDEVETPASDTLTIEGNYRSVAAGTFASNDKGFSNYCGCITAVNDWGSMTEIMNNAFYNCTGLTSVHIPDSVTTIGYNAFYNCTGLTSVHIPDSVTTIGSGGFRNCASLALESLPNSVTDIGSHAFAGCYGLKFTDDFFKSGLVSIGQSAFALSAGDEALLQSFSITIPETVTNIGARAFEGPLVGAYSYTYFKKVTMLPTTPPTGLGADYSVFGKVHTWTNSNDFSIIVPVGCSETYKAAEGWSTYADKIVEAS